MNKTAVVILNWNGLDYLRKFLETVIRFSEDSDTVVYVADNGSTDGSQEWISDNFSTVRLISLKKNSGFAGGYNRALKQIKAKYYILLNSDIEVTQNWLEPVINFLDNNPDVASCQPKILSYFKRDHFEYAGAAGSFIDKYGYPFCRGRIFNIIEKDDGQYDSTTEVFWSSGACMAVRATAWEKCGGFDEDFFAHMEEIDLCWRFHKMGFKVYYIPDSSVYHVGGATLPYDSPFKIYLNFRNSLFLLYKNLPDRDIRNILFIRKLLDFCAACLFLLKGNIRGFRSVCKAHFDYYRSLKTLKTKRETFNKHNMTKDISLPILNKSIVIEFYLKGRKTYQDLAKYISG